MLQGSLSQELHDLGDILQARTREASQQRREVQRRCPPPPPPPPGGAFSSLEKQLVPVHLSGCKICPPVHLDASQAHVFFTAFMDHGVSHSLHQASECQIAYSCTDRDFSPGSLPVFEPAGTVEISVAQSLGKHTAFHDLIALTSPGGTQRYSTVMGN